jgi:hypothetical protein
MVKAKKGSARISSRIIARRLAVLAIITSGLGVDEVHAQGQSGNAAVQQARLFMERPDAVSSRGERLAPVEAPTGGESAADADLGEQWMLRPNVRPTPFTVRASLSLFYTDNVALSRRSTLEDGFAVADFGIGYSRAFAPDWAFAIDLQQSLFRYDRNREFDFESSNVSVALSYQARQLGDIVFSLQYGLNRLTSGAFDDQLFLGNTFSLVALKVVPVTSAGAVEFTGAVGYTFADPQELARAEFRFGVGYRLQIARAFSASAAARLELYDYEREGRTDLLQAVALGVRYELTQWLFLSASVSAASNISTESVFSYTAINAGATIAANYQF